MKKSSSEDKVLAVGFIALMIAVASFSLVWFDIWPGAKLIVQISMLIGVGAVAVGLLLRQISDQGDHKGPK